MTTADTIITRLQQEFDCRLTTEQILGIINALEKRLAVDLVQKTRLTKIKVIKGRILYSLGFSSKYITKVFTDDGEIKKKSASNLNGYSCDGTNIVFTEPVDEEYIYIESIIVPEDISEAEASSRELFLGDGYDEIYLYHVLSREALMSGNIDMLNNYSLLYAEALNSLRAEVFKFQNSATKYKNVW